MACSVGLQPNVFHEATARGLTVEGDARHRRCYDPPMPPQIVMSYLF